MTDEDLITSREVAKMLGVSASTVLRLTRAGTLTPAQRIPTGRGVYLFRRADVERLGSEISPLTRSKVLADAAKDWADKHQPGDTVTGQEVTDWLYEQSQNVLSGPSR